LAEIALPVSVVVECFLGVGKPVLDSVQLRRRSVQFGHDVTQVVQQLLAFFFCLVQPGFDGLEFCYGSLQCSRIMNYAALA